jgi:hypothetical protein
VVSVLCTALAVATPASSTTRRYVRTTLDTPAQPIESAAPRAIRRSLDDPGHTAFPLADDTSRLIRVTLDDAAEPYGRLSSPERKARRVRTSLD